MIKHKVGGYIHDITRNKVNRIIGIGYDSMFDEYSLGLDDGGSTHYLEPHLLDALYPYLGDNRILVNLLFKVNDVGMCWLD
jgi:hypothetical protein